MLVILPFWTSFLLRVYAWVGLLKNDGLINNALMALGIINEPLTMMNTSFAVYIGIVYSYLPFMILPLYSNLEKHDLTLLEAAQDLGSGPIRSFLRITLPSSLDALRSCGSRTTVRLCLRYGAHFFSSLAHSSRIERNRRSGTAAPICCAALVIASRATAVGMSSVRRANSWS